MTDVNVYVSLTGIRGALLESEDHECPDCREKEIAPTTLIPNRLVYVNAKKSLKLMFLIVTFSKSFYFVSPVPLSVYIYLIK